MAIVTVMPLSAASPITKVTLCVLKLKAAEKPKRKDSDFDVKFCCDILSIMNEKTTRKPDVQADLSTAPQTVENLPAKQGTQVEFDFAPSEPEYVPILQSMHVESLDAPTKLEYLPA